MLLVSTYVAASEIEGLGVFATSAIAKGTAIWRFDPDFDRLISRQRYDDAPPHLRELLDRYSYPSPDLPGFRVYDADNGRFMNHADAPNTDFSRYGIGTASRDILAGEELTCDYGEFHDTFDLLPSAAADSP